VLVRLLGLEGLDRPGHRIYNVGTGRAHSVREVIAACERATGRPVPHGDGPRRPGDIVVAVAEPSRFRRDAGFEATCALDEMVASAWRWWLDNPDGYGARAA